MANILFPSNRLVNGLYLRPASMTNRVRNGLERPQIAPFGAARSLERIAPSPIRGRVRPVTALHVRWTRAELVAVREAIEITPLFEGRAGVRLTIRGALRANRRDVVLDHVQAERLASHLVPVDMQTAVAKVKLLRAIREARSEQAAAQAVHAA